MHPFRIRVGFAALSLLAGGAFFTDIAAAKEPKKQAEVTSASNEAAEPRPFDEAANAMQDVDAALLAAAADGKHPLLVLGGNWCHDSRDLAKKFEGEPLQSLVSSKFHTVWVDVGRRDRNLDVATRFGVEKLLGTPTVLILSPEGELLNADSVHDWRTSATRTADEALAYFESFAPGSK